MKRNQQGGGTVADVVAASIMGAVFVTFFAWAVIDALALPP